MSSRHAFALFTCLFLGAACSKSGSTAATSQPGGRAAASQPTSKPTSKPTSRPSKMVASTPGDPTVLPVPDESNIPADAGLATLAGGCFWCTEETFMQLPGILAVVSGYAGGKKETADYKLVCSGFTEHAEAINVYYDKGQLDYRKVIDHFWKVHDPTTLNRQGNDRGPQYRSAIFYRTDEEKATAEASMAAFDASGKYPAKAVTQIVPVTTFFDAEDYHQNYYRKNPDDRYCRAVLVPKLRKLGYHVAGELPPTLREEPGAKGAEVLPAPPTGWVKPSDEELKSTLNSIQYNVTQEDGTERAFTGPYWDNKEPGVYVDIVGGRPLFSSQDKFRSGTGWPSFTQPIDKREVAEIADNSHGWQRVEVRSKTADSHLGHVFTDGPAPTGLRYCINGNALRFIPLADLEKEGLAELKKLFEEPKP